VTRVEERRRGKLVVATPLPLFGYLREFAEVRITLILTIAHESF
jgi:hypothetical protein